MCTFFNMYTISSIIRKLAGGGGETRTHFYTLYQWNEHCYACMARNLMSKLYTNILKRHIKRLILVNNNQKNMVKWGNENYQTYVGWLQYNRSLIMKHSFDVTAILHIQYIEVYILISQGWTFIVRRLITVL